MKNKYLSKIIITLECIAFAAFIFIPGLLSEKDSTPTMLHNENYLFTEVNQPDTDTPEDRKSVV